MIPLVERVKTLLERCTPGPWRLRDGRDRGMSFWVDSPNCEVENNRGPNYTRQILEDDDYPEKEFDAALIALCPAMAKELVELAGEVERLKAALTETADYLDRIASTLEAWANESRNGGWSTHQVDANRREADIARQAAGRARTLTRSTKPEGQE